MPTETAPELPRDVGGFRLLRMLGRGGMGVVYEAEELASGRRVALKVLARELTLSDEAFERFRREARIAASVSDSACVFVFGAHQIEGAPAISMELCPGETLEHRLRQKEPVPVADAVRWTIEMLDGLEAAHQTGIVHRDVKPSNCFTTADGHVKIGDFGLSRSLAEDVQLTQSGVFLGSPLYASPEQIKGRAVDFKSDLYSVGATLYALLVGHSPYRGTNIGEVLARILSEPPDSITAERKDVPPALEKVVLRAMAREPGARYASHAAMRDALRPFAAIETKASSPLRRLCGYALDGAILSMVHLPIIGIWSRYDPDLIQPSAIRILQIQKPGVQLLGALIGFTYFGLSETLFRRTLGKWTTGQRVVVDGDSGGLSKRPLLRAALWTLPGLAIVLLRFLPFAQGIWVRTILAGGPVYLLLYVAMLSTMRSRNGWRGVHELLSGTRVVAEPLPFSRFVARRAPPKSILSPADLAPQTFGSYTTVGRVGRTATGEIFEANDPQLDRRVWIHAPSAEAAAMQASRRSLERSTRLRWLAAIDVGGRRHEVFEAPGGARLSDCAADASGVDWPTTHRLLTTLAAELDAPDAPIPTIDQVWVDRSWNLRILDEPLVLDGRQVDGRSEGGLSDGPRSGGAKAEAPLDLLSHVARTCSGTTSGDLRLPPDLPEHAEPTVRALIGLSDPFRSLPDLRRALGGLAGRPQGLTWQIRGLQILLSSGLVALFSLFFVVGIQFVAMPQLVRIDQARPVLRELRTGRKLLPEDLKDVAKDPTGPELQDQERRDRMLVVGEIRERTAAVGTQVWVQFPPEEQAIAERARSESAGVAPAEIEAAAARIQADRAPGVDGSRTKTRTGLEVARYAMPGLGAVIFLLFSTAFAFAFRGGLSFRFLSISVRNSRGSKAGRFRCLLRALATAIPFVVLYGSPVAGYFLVGRTFAAAAFAIAIAAHLGLVVASLRNPTRGWQDRIVGTRLVPR